MNKRWCCLFIYFLSLSSVGFSQEYLNFLDSRNDITLVAHNGAELIKRGHRFIANHGLDKKLRQVLTENQDSPLNRKTFNRIQGLVTRLLNWNKVGSTIFTFRLDRSAQWNLLIKCESLDADQLRLFERNYNGLHNELGTLGFDLPEVGFDSKEDWLVIYPAENDKPEILDRIGANNNRSPNRFRSVADDRGMNIVRSKLKDGLDLKGKVDVFFSRRLLSALADLGLSKQMQDILDLREVKQIGAQLHFFDRQEGNDQKVAGLFGLNCYAILGQPKSEIHALFNQPLEKKRPEFRNDLASFQLNLDATKLRKVADLSNEDARKEFSQWIQMVMLGVSADEELLQEIEGEIGIYLVESAQKAGRIVNLRSFKLRPDANEDLVIAKMIRNAISRFSLKPEESENVKIKTSRLNSVRYWSAKGVTIANYKNTYFFGFSDSLGATLSQLENDETNYRTAKRNKVIKETYSHQNAPFFVGSFSSKFQAGWLGDTIAFQKKLAKKKTELSLADKVQLAALDMQIVLMESIGHQVIAISSDHEGIKASMVIFKR